MTYGRQRLVRPFRQVIRRQVIDLMIGLLGIPVGLAAGAQRCFDRPVPLKPKRILVIRLDLLGDIVLSLPAVRSLRSAFPSAQIDLLVQPAAEELARLCPAIDRVLVIDIQRVRPSAEPTSQTAWRAIWRVVRALRAERYDVVIGLFGAWSSLLALVSSAPMRVGFRDEGFPLVYSRSVPGRRYRRRVHESRYSLKLAREAGGLAPSESPDLVVPAGAKERAQQLLRTEGWNGRPLVICHAGSSTADAKRWTPEGWAELISRLRAARANVAMIGAANERALATEILDRSGEAGGVINLAGLTTLVELVAVIDQADLVISGDSGPLHIAGALRRPVVAVHGPSDPAISGPIDPRSPVVRLNLPCSPCYDATFPPTCPLGHHHCLRNLSGDQVAAVALPLIGGTATS